MIKYFLLVTTLLASPAVYGQTHSAPFKGANTILIQTNDSASVALVKIGQILVSQGYTIQKLDKQFLTLISTPKSIPFYTGPISLTIQATAVNAYPASLLLTGPYTFSLGGNPATGAAKYLPGVLRGSGNSRTFSELEKAAAAYPDSTVGYEKR